MPTDPPVPDALGLPDGQAGRLKSRRRRIRGLLARLEGTLAALAARLDAKHRSPAAEMLDAEGVAAMLSVSPRSVRAMNAADEMPRPVKLRGRVRLPSSSPNVPTLWSVTTGLDCCDERA
jgi:hypothetical protein